MAGDSRTRGPRAELGEHVWALSDCSMTPCNALGMIRLSQTASDDVTCAGRASSAPRRPSMSVTELGAGPHEVSSSVAGRAGWCVPRGDAGPSAALPAPPGPQHRPLALSPLPGSQILDSTLRVWGGMLHLWEALKNVCDVNKLINERE